MRALFSGLVLLASCMPAMAMHSLEEAINNARTSCGVISDELKELRTRAGVGIATSALGTLSGGLAVNAGIEKHEIDNWISLLEQQKKDPQTYTTIDYDAIKRALDSTLFAVSDEDNYEVALNKKSTQLGHMRTGTLAATTAANIAGAAVGGVNMKKARGSLTEQVSDCLASIKELSAAYGQARISRSADEEELERVATIVRVCNEWSTVDLSKIDKRATGSFASSVVGTTTGAAGTITSALANTQGVREGDATKEKNLNLTANVMAGGATVASTAATIFNATQISAIKRASTVADACEGALN